MQAASDYIRHLYFQLASLARYLFLLLLAAMLQQVAAQPFPWPVFTSYTQSSGLPSATVQGLARDERGYLWAATPAGLARFNGRRFEPILLTDSSGRPVEQEIKNIVLDHQQRLWVLLPNELGWVNHRTLRYTRVSSYVYRAISKDAKGNVHAFTQDSMFIFIDRTVLSKQTGMPFDGMKPFDKSRHLFWSGNTLLLADSDWRISQILSIAQDNQPEPVTIRDVWVYAPDKVFIASYGKGVLCFNPQTGTLQPLPGFKGRSTCKSLTMWKDLQGKQWLLAAADRQWWMIDPESLAYHILQHQPGDVHGFPFANQSLLVYTDAQGIVWTGNEDGIAAIEPFRQQMHRLNFSSAVRWGGKPVFDGLAMSLSIKSDGYRVGGWYSKGWHWFDAAWAHQQSVQQLHGSHQLLWQGVYGQYWQQPDTWWLSSDSGLLRKSNGQTTAYFPPGAKHADDFILRNISRYNDSLLMVCGRKGIFIFNTASQQFQQSYWANGSGESGLPDANVVASYLSSSGHLYASTSKGWFRKKRNSNRFQLLLNTATGAATNGFAGMAESPSGEVYVGSKNGIYVVQEGADAVKALSDVPATNIFKLQFDKNGQLWATTATGIWCRLAIGNWWQLNTANSAVPNDYMDGYFEKDSLGNLYAGANKWHVDFNPSALIAARPIPIIDVDAAMVNGEIFLPEAQMLSLPAGTTTFTLLVNNLNFDGSPGSELWYRLQHESDTGWHRVGDGKILFANLGPGRYTLDIRGPIDLVTMPYSCTVEIAAFWYQQWWFYACCVLIAALLLWWLVWRQMRQQRMVALHEKQLKEAQMQALRTQMNPHFVFNSLNSINSFILDQKTDEASEYLTTFSKLLRNTLELTRNNTVKLDRELAALQLYIDLEKTRVPHFDYRISIGETVQPDMIEVPPLILQPFVENAIWHGLGNKKETGHLHINVQLCEPSVALITIADDGIGRAATQHIQKSHTSLGIEITEHRLKMLNAANQVLYEDLYSNGKAAGTMVKLYLHLH